ncbi:MAG: AmmeMemoRadiSam system radical SAM enzyme [Lentisphaerae bacterium]|jgi:pyruvate formate lyase activating enzyme|nr:AmmeMemoRadiSam system radical SAM enzyme [Lentisphaerota bacterium]MBT4823297.1 AmmeMemoRadiSam system radical SAM enzyme [Lentisphaerota bacterium]MBT5609819.1 AmmeMemoRadiSam system radical SAM enzyme [Lentisphaerota bacterium]MBT7055137.1 AmmeMemoRadiSam system radical SAM enzyme [Lentisphaerota bacterium]MBT7846309.1 AmmeMemoRadiSam system radical SAM enzyme [Lentisphaerota bacterium]
MWQQFLASFTAGLALGPSCILHCGVYHAAFLARHADPARGRNATLGVALILGRLSAYLLFGLLLGLVATSGLLVVQPWVLTLTLAVVMAVYALKPQRKKSGCGCRKKRSLVAGSGFLLGFVTGLSPCPPFLASGLIALKSHGVSAAVFTLLAFFVGSSVYMIPVWFGIVALPQRVNARLRVVSRLLAACVAVYASVSLTTMLRQGDEPAIHGRGSASAGLLLAQRAEREKLREAPTKARVGQQRPPVKLPPPAGNDVTPLFLKEPPTRTFTEALLRRLDMSLKEALFYTPLDEDEVQCNLCPSECILADGEQGLCRARVNIGGKLRSIVYERPVSIHIDPIEKKPLFHVLPESQAMSLATAGCNLGCVFCQNFEISQAAPEEIRRHKVSPEKMVALTLAKGCQGIAYTYTEPTIFYEYMLDIATLAKAKGIRNYWITCGQIEEAPLVELCKVMDAANVDLKGFSDDFYVEYCNAHLFPVLRTLKILRREEVFFEITNLLVPEANDSPEMIEDMCRWIVAELGADTPVHFSRFHPDYKLTKRPPTPIETLLMARDVAQKAGLKYVYIGNVRDPKGGTTTCPVCAKSLIRRMGYVVAYNRVKDGRCEHCGAPITGIWK